MATPLNNLPQSCDASTSQEMQNDDNSQLVSEILQEMNNNGAEDSGMVDQTNYDPNIANLTRQMDPNVNMMASDNIHQGEQIVNQPTVEITVDSESSESMKDTVLRLVKEPLIVSAITVLIFSPIVKNLLIKYASRIYASTSVGMKWTGLTLQALIVGLAYFAVKQVV